MTKTAPKKRIAKDASRRIDEKIAALGDWRGERLAEIRKLIHGVDPVVVEEWKWMGSPVWSHEGMYALANAHKDKVKLTFVHGAELPDPKKLFNAGLAGNKWRAIDFREGDEIDKPGLKALLREAVAYNTRHSVPKSKGSRPGVNTKAGKSAAKLYRSLAGLEARRRAVCRPRRPTRRWSCRGTAAPRARRGSSRASSGLSGRILPRATGLPRNVAGEQHRPSRGSRRSSEGRE